MTPDGKLHPQDCISLAAIASHPGYAIILAIAEREIENLQRDTVNVHPSKHHEVLAAQAIAHGAADFWKKVREEMEEAIRQAGVKPAEPLTKEQMAIAEQAETLDPTDRRGLRVMPA